MDSCLYVWLNGEYVGYNQISHSTSEFDVTDKIREGENTLAVLVLKWCDGSYLEDQDKFRTSGIFRDVYIIKRPENHVRDYFVTTQQEEDKATVRVRFAFAGESVPTVIRLLDAEDRLIDAAEVTTKEHIGNYTHQAILNIPQPTLWNPEKPYLYTMLVECENEIITDRVGIREIKVDGMQVFLNSHQVPRCKPPRFRPRDRPRHQRGAHEARPADDQGAQLQRHSHQPLPQRPHVLSAVRPVRFPGH